MKALIGAGAAIASSLLAVCPIEADAAIRSAVVRDVESYAISRCFAALRQPIPEAPDTLKEQADLWAGAIVQRGHGNIEEFNRVLRAVQSEMAKQAIPVAHGDGGPTADKPAFLAYCVEMIDVPTVRQAIDRTVARLAPAYRKR